MGLKCSVFGHDYADYDVERDRADHGGEVVTTVRTTEICRRCGDARIVSENTEIAAASAATPTPTPAADGSREKVGNENRDAADGTSPGDGDGRIEPGRDRADHARDAGGSEGYAPRSGTDGFEFDASAGDDRAPETSERGSFGPTTAHATSRSLAESELRCGACEFNEAMLGSPLRAGDSCPQCSRGYLARRTRKE